MAALELIRQGNEVEYVYTYGTPRIGNEAFARYFSKYVPCAYRINHFKDIVPHIPWRNNFLSGSYYNQFPYEVWYHTRRGTDYTKDYVVCEGKNDWGEDENCSNQNTNASVDDHLWSVDMPCGCNALTPKDPLEFKNLYEESEDIQEIKSYY